MWRVHAEEQQGRQSMSLHAGRWIDVVEGACGSFLPMASIFSVYRKQSHHDSEGLKV